MANFRKGMTDKLKKNACKIAYLGSIFKPEKYVFRVCFESPSTRMVSNLKYKWPPDVLSTADSTLDHCVLLLSTVFCNGSLLSTTNSILDYCISIVDIILKILLVVCWNSDVELIFFYCTIMPFWGALKAAGQWDNFVMLLLLWELSV